MLESREDSQSLRQRLSGDLVLQGLLVFLQEIEETVQLLLGLFVLLLGQPGLDEAKVLHDFSELLKFQAIICELWLAQIHQCFLELVVEGFYSLFVIIKF